MNPGILYIGHSTLFRSNLAQHLRAEKLRVISVDATEDYLKSIRKNRIDLVLINLVDLGRQGIETLSLVKKYKPVLEVILINVSDRISLSIEGMRLGAFDDFILPFDMTIFLTRAREAIEKKKKVRSRGKNWQQKYEQMMMAISFAEVGETETARRFLKNDVNDFTQSDSDKPMSS